MSFRVVEQSFGDYVSVSQKSFPTILDNSTCTDAGGAYNVRAVISEEAQVLTESESERQQTNPALACGSVDMNGGGPKGPLALAIGFLLVAASTRLRQFQNHLK